MLRDLVEVKGGPVESMKSGDTKDNVVVRGINWNCTGGRDSWIQLQ